MNQADLLHLGKRAARALLTRSQFARLKMLRLALSKGEHAQIPEIQPIVPYRSAVTEPRLNLLVPGVSPANRFGGALTALDFFSRFGHRFSRLRLVVTDEAPGTRPAPYGEFEPVPTSTDCDHARTAVYVAERRKRRLAVGPADLFIATAWWDAHLARRLIEWQSECYGPAVRPLVYLVQDYEPGFYPWSSRYLLARSTYDLPGPVAAVFNTSLLRDYITGQGHAFDREFVFEPRMDARLREVCSRARASAPPKRRQILVYGRPSIARNAFGLVCTALRAWASRVPNAGAWELISAGEDHPDVELGGGAVLRSVGKLSLEEYARVLLESAVGLSLMVSPHPSYPPLEMAHFGVRVVTNAFANKQLSAWHENIVSLEDASPGRIAHELERLCAMGEAEPTAGWRARSFRPEYLESGPQFPFIDELSEMLLGR